MKYKKLEKNLADIMAEQQIKLGYFPGKMYIFYPLSSLCNLLGKKMTIAEMTEELKGFSTSVEMDFGKIDISNSGERFCLLISEKGNDYIHEKIDNYSFLEKFIKTISKHEITMEELFEIFRSYSENVVIEKSNDEDFDYIVHFKDEKPDNMYYCLKNEGKHIIYHRFIKEDFMDLFK